MCDEQRNRLRQEQQKGTIGGSNCKDNASNPNEKRFQSERQSAELGRQRFGKHNTQRNKSSWENFPTQPPICNGDDGLSSGLDGITFPKWRNESIKGGGNAIVPQVVYQIFKAIEDYEQSITT